MLPEGFPFHQFNTQKSNPGRLTPLADALPLGHQDIGGIFYGHASYLYQRYTSKYIETKQICGAIRFKTKSFFKYFNMQR